jgi:FAD/FMN-containing dehydrogenase
MDASLADRDNEPELFWAVRGGGGNFGVVTSMRHRLHEMPSVRSGVLVYPFSEAEVVLERCAGIAASAREELTFQVALAAGSDGDPAVMIVPTWCGSPSEGEAPLAPLLRLGTLLVHGVTM